MNVFEFLKEKVEEKGPHYDKLKCKIDEYRDSNWKDRDALQYLILLNLVERVYLRSYDIGELPTMSDFLYENRHNEIIKDLLDIEEEKLDDEDYVREVIYDSDIDNFNTFDEIFVYVYKNYDKLSIEDRIELIREYFSDWIDWY